MVLLYCYVEIIQCPDGSLRLSLMLLILILVTTNRHVLSSLLVLYVNITSQPLSSVAHDHLSPARVPFSLQFFLIGVVFVIFYVEVVVVVVSLNLYLLCLLFGFGLRSFVSLHFSMNECTTSSLFILLYSLVTTTFAC